jgi:dTDP-glucose pyrophosphorylase
MKPTLVILAAGMGSRYGGLKQIDGVGPSEEGIIEYSIYDAIRAGFGKVVFIIRKDIEAPFREKFDGKFGDQIEVAYAFQGMDSYVPADVDHTQREKPWGTSHAMLVAKEVVKEPFAVINADDYYGTKAFAKMAKFLTEEASPELFSMVGYVLHRTLSDHGTVNRGVTVVAEDYLLQDVNERLKIQTG